MMGKTTLPILFGPRAIQGVIIRDQDAFPGSSELIEGFSAPMSVDIEENDQSRSHKPQPVFDRSKWTKHGPTGFIDIVNRGLTRDFADFRPVSLQCPAATINQPVQPSQGERNRFPFFRSKEVGLCQKIQKRPPSAPQKSRCRTNESCEVWSVAGRVLSRNFGLAFLATIGATPLVQINVDDMEQDLRQFAILMSVERAQIYELFTTTTAPPGENFPYVLRFAEFLAIALVPFLASLPAFGLLFRIWLGILALVLNSWLAWAIPALIWLRLV